MHRVTMRVARTYLRHPRRAAFSMSELLVVIGIIGILFSLLLPAVMAARESARRTQCQSHIRQLSLACQHYESAHRFLPSNGWGYRWIGDPSRGFGRRQPGGWIFQVSPYLELDFKPASFSKSDLADLMVVPAPWLHCPSRPAPTLGPMNTRTIPYNGELRSQVTKTDYAICEGDYITNTQGGPTTLEEGDSPDYVWTDVSPATGVSFLRSEVAMSDVRDGASNVYLLGEKYVSADHYATNRDLGYDQAFVVGVDLDINRWTIEPPWPDGEESNYRSFGSAHPGYFNMAFCDGSVRSTDFNIDRELHRRLGNRRDGRATESRVD